MPVFAADLPETFIHIGNERETITDEQTGREIVFLTGPEYVDTLYYPTCRSWTKDGRFLLLESERPRPDGSHKPLERQLLMADVETGDLYWLATLDVENTVQYGDRHLRMSSQFHADYCPDKNRIVYYDMTGHNLYLLDLATGHTEHLYHMSSGTIGDPPSIAEDGSRVVFYAGHPGPPETDWFTGRTFTIYALDLDRETGKAKGEPYVITSYTARKGKSYRENPRDTIHINHCQINPADPDEIGYAHEYGGSPTDGSVAKARIWFTRVDGSDDGPLTLTPVGRWHTHEVWGPLGEWMYYVDSGEVVRINAQTREIEMLTNNMQPRATHIAVSRDEKVVVADAFSGMGTAPDGNPLSGVVRVDVETGKTELLAVQPYHRSHPRHTHPNISPDGSKVGITAACRNTSRVGYIELR
jgi:Tol biopolymer transport system component